MFAKNKLASAVAAAIGVSAVGVAQAESVFFPYVVVSPTVTTIVSVINATDKNWALGGQNRRGTERLHYRLFYKMGDNANKLDVKCDEYNEYLPTSLNDIQTIDLGGYFDNNSLGVLFNDPSVNNNWRGGGLDYAMARGLAPVRGYLTVDNSYADRRVINNGATAAEVTAEARARATGAAPSIAGEAFIFEFENGAAWGYQAYSSLPPRGAADESYFQDFRYAASQSPHAVALMPPAEVTTAFFVTPVSQNQHPDVDNTYRARIDIRTTDRGDMYDRDENLVSGTKPADVVCVGRVDATALMSDGLAARLRPTGGWGLMWNYRLVQVGSNFVPANFAAYNATASTGGLVPAPANPAAGVRAAPQYNADDGAVVIKLEYGTSINGQDANGTWNNGFILRPDPNNQWLRNF